MGAYDGLFEPFSYRGRTWRNRVVMPPMVSVRDVAGEDGRRWYAERAAGGVGMVIVEATTLGKLIEASLPGLRLLVDAIHKAGALAAIQIYSNGNPEPEEFFYEQAHDPHELTRDQLQGLVAHFGRAADVCRRAGFDGVEPHGAHGYFLTRCFSPVVNKRDDDYGGSLEGRMRMAVEVCRVVRAAIGDEMLLLYRHTCVEGVEGGCTMDESLTLLETLVGEGVDILDISPSHTEETDGAYSQAVKLAIDRPVIGVGGLDEPDRAAAMLAEGKADLVAVGRGLIADAQWPAKVHDGRVDEITECIRCNELCFGNLKKREPIACTQWASGR